ncbi:hypothetical protein GGI15_003846 [Coemansia interrupta]|uniref:CMP/dCMP-type deaminase domain-containing protein n=1 Tax=Coemansia interrupta TaxID=1126814 RepID=A0A9W8H7J2_9FUNG|nr:hypothetical protein GGI15_003846 [Coemansia interrupta]
MTVDNSSRKHGSFTVIRCDDGSREVEKHTAFIRLAIMQANMALPSDTSFSTGVLVVNGTHVVAEGHSREPHTPGLHAAVVAINKARQSPQRRLLRGATLYTTMEPCSSDKVSKTPCTRHIIEAGIAKVVIGVKEPDSFVDCKGVRTLQDAGIHVVHMQFLQEECLRPNIHLLT